MDKANPNKNSFNRESDEQSQIKRVPYEDLDPFKIFVNKMDYLNSLR